MSGASPAEMYFDKHWEGTGSSVADACRKGDTETLKVLLSMYPLDLRDNRGWIPLHEAAANNRLECLKILLKTAKNLINCVSHEGETPLRIALLNGHGSTAEMLLRAGADPNLCNNHSESPLHAAVANGLVRTARRLILAGAVKDKTDYAGETPLIVALTKRIVGCVKLLVTHDSRLDTIDNHGRTPLFIAAETGDINVLKLILDKINLTNPCLVERQAFDGTTPVMIAAQSGSVECVQQLFELGGNVNRMANDGYTALSLAVNGGHFECAKLLAPLTDENIKRRTCHGNFVCLLHLALRANHERRRCDTLKLLCSELDVKSCVVKGARSSILDSYYSTLYYIYKENKSDFKTTLLCHAIETGDLNCVKEIIEKGGEVNCISTNFIHPLVPAVFLNELEIVKLLLRHGSNPNQIIKRSGKSFPIFLELCGIHHINEALIEVLKASADFRLCKNVDFEKVNKHHHKCLTILAKVFLAKPLSESDLTNLQKYTRINTGNSGKIKTDFTSNSLQHICRVTILHTLLDARKGSPVNEIISKLPLTEQTLSYLSYPDL
ncbi:hypothetical protein CHUAL_001137 [Chamberlinius hualienensis]